jgi:large subunit ribosomal protein L17
MRHRLAGRNLSRNSAHRRALRKSLCQALFQHDRIRTTLAKAKEIRPMAEKLISIAKKGDLASRRLVIRLMGDRSLATEKDPASTDSVVRRLFREVAPRFADRPGGYTRIVKLADHRIGDGSPLVLLELVAEETERRKAPKSRRKKASAKGREAAKMPKEQVVAEADKQVETTAGSEPAAGAAEGEASEPPKAEDEKQKPAE